MKRSHGLALAIGLLTAVVLAGCVSPAPQTRDPKERAVTADGREIPEDSWERWDKEGSFRLRTGIGSYFANRWYDFTDMFDVGLSFGKWARIEADYLIGFWGFGALDCQRWRFGQRSFVLNDESTTVCSLPFPASLILWPATLNSDDEVMSTILTLGGVSYESEYAIWPEPVFAGIPQYQERIRITGIERDPKSHRFVVTGNSFPVGAEVHLFIGARARVMPIQIFDFITGIFGWDLAHDDVKPYYPKMYESPRPAQP